MCFFFLIRCSSSGDRIRVVVQTFGKAFFTGNILKGLCSNPQPTSNRHGGRVYQKRVILASILENLHLFETSLSVKDGESEREHQRQQAHGGEECFGKRPSSWALNVNRNSAMCRSLMCLLYYWDLLGKCDFHS